MRRAQPVSMELSSPASHKPRRITLGPPQPVLPLSQTQTFGAASAVSGHGTNPAAPVRTDAASETTVVASRESVVTGARITLGSIKPVQPLQSAASKRKRVTIGAATAAPPLSRSHALPPIPRGELQHAEPSDDSIAQPCADGSTTKPRPTGSVLAFPAEPVPSSSSSSDRPDESPSSPTLSSPALAVRAAADLECGGDAPTIEVAEPKAQTEAETMQRGARLGNEGADSLKVPELKLDGLPAGREDGLPAGREDGLPAARRRQRQEGPDQRSYFHTTSLSLHTKAHVKRKVAYSNMMDDDDASSYLISTVTGMEATTIYLISTVTGMEAITIYLISTVTGMEATTVYLISTVTAMEAATIYLISTVTGPTYRHRIHVHVHMRAQARTDVCRGR